MSLLNSDLTYTQSPVHMDCGSLLSFSILCSTQTPEKSEFVPGAGSSGMQLAVVKLRWEKKMKPSWDAGNQAAPLLARWLRHAPFSFQGFLLGSTPLSEAVGLAPAPPVLSTPSHVMSWQQSPQQRKQGREIKQGWEGRGSEDQDLGEATPRQGQKRYQTTQQPTRDRETEAHSKDCNPLKSHTRSWGHPTLQGSWTWD